MSCSTDRFWAKVDRDTSHPASDDPYSTAEGNCWIWTGSLAENGYGMIRREGKLVRVHRFSYELEKGEIPAGKVIDHLCRNRPCVRPSHLEAVTQQENIHRGKLRAERLARKSCKNGHEYTEETTRNVLTRTGPARKCKTCEREYNAEHRKKK